MLLSMTAISLLMVQTSRGTSISIPALAVSYTITDIGTLGGPNSGAFAINDNGDIVGVAEAAPGKYGPLRHACLWHDGKIIDLGEGYACDINNQGQCVGMSNTKGFLYQHGTIQTLKMRVAGVDRVASAAIRINDLAEIIGCIYTDEQTISFCWRNGKVQHLWTGEDFVVAGINNKGSFVGQRHGIAALYRADKWWKLGTLGGPSSEAMCVNDDDVVAGIADTVDSEDPAEGVQAMRVRATFLWRKGKITAVENFARKAQTDKIPFRNNHKMFGFFPYVPDGKGGLQHVSTLLPRDSGWTEIEAACINKHGQIVGKGKIKGLYHAFLLSPTTGNK